MAVRFTLKNVVLSFPSLAQARVNKMAPNAAPRYDATFLIDPSDEANLKTLRGALKSALEARFPDKSKLPAVLRASDLNVYVSMTGKDGWPLRDGNMRDNAKGFENKLYIKASNKSAPFTIDEQFHNCPPDKFYGGCVVDACLEAAAYDTDSAKGVSAYLCGVRFVADGEHFGSAPAKASDFFPQAADEDAASSYDV